MEKEKIARINALAHKAKTSGLTEAGGDDNEKRKYSGS